VNKELKAINLTWLSKTSLTNLNAGEGETNLVDVKKYRSQDVEYPYVSGQAMRFYLRESIRRTLDKEVTMCVPDEKGETCGDPAKCLNCDLFGYMRTTKKTTEKAGGATRRVSPVKVAPAMGLLPFDENAVLDFLTRRHPKEKGELEGDIANVEIGTNIYRCGAAIDIRRVGAEEDWAKGEVKLDEFLSGKAKLDRIRKVIDGIRFISDYSKQARLLTDFTPDVLCVTFQTRYSHRLQKLFELDKELTLDPKRVKEILADVTGYSDKVFFGLISGLIKNEDDIVKVFKEFKIEKQRPDEVFEAALKELA
jgi:CRISPR-associated protein Cst2